MTDPVLADLLAERFGKSTWFARPQEHVDREMLRLLELNEAVRRTENNDDPEVV